MNSGFSIVIPTCNRAGILNKTLERLERVTYAGNWEVVVIDDGSTDDTERIVKDFKRKKTMRLRYRYQAQFGPSRARNTGIALSRYPYVILLDDDIRVGRNFLLQYSRCIQQHPEAQVIGANVNKLLSNDMRKLQEYVNIFQNQLWLFALTKQRRVKERKLIYPDSISSACLCINKQNIKAVFNELLGTYYGNYFMGAEDYEYIMKLLREGDVIILDYTIRVSHYISDKRLNGIAMVKRLFFTGVEHGLADTLLFKRNPDVDRYGYIASDSIQCVKLFVKRRQMFLLASLLNNLLFITGYSLSPFILAGQKIRSRNS